MKNLTSFALLLLSLGRLWGQVDDEFWFVAPDVISGHGDLPIYIRFATFDVPANVTVDMPANGAYDAFEFTIPASSAYSLDLSSLVDMHENQPFNEVLDKGVQITSSSAISAYYEVSHVNNPDIFALKGDNALGTSFHLPFQNFTDNGFNTTSGFDIVATEANTVVTVTPTQDLIGHPAGVPFDITLPFAGSTYSGRALGSGASDHATGTTITSNLPVAVTVHDDSASGAMFGGGCLDLMGDQIVPDQVLGTEYVAVHGYLGGDDRLQIVATQNNTSVTVDGATVATLQAGQSHSHTLNTPSAFIESSAPVAIWQSTGFGCELGGAQLPSVKCTGSTSTVFVRSTSETMRLNILVPNGGQGDFLFNGNAGVINATNFAVVPGNTDWMFAQVTTLEGQIPVGEATRIENTSTPFHLGIINGGASSGTRFGYFSDYGALKYETSYQQLNPCLGDPLELAVSPIENGLYQWTGPNNFSATGLEVNVGIANTNTAGIYVVQGFTGECEIENDSLEVVVHQPLPPPVLSGDIETCEGLTISMGADSENVLWTGPEGFESQGQYVVIDNIAVADAGVYTATLDDPYCPPGAESSLVVTVATDEDLAFVWEDDREFCQGEEVVIGLPSEVFGSPDINWVFYEEGVDEPLVLATGQDATVTSAGMLVVEAFSEPPCVVRSEGVIHITYADCDLVIPNVITPGDDNLNKRFKVTNLNQFPNSSIQIFNRWGQEVFSHDDFGSTSGWLPEQDLSEGAYYFVLHVARTDQVIGVQTENGVTTYDQPGAIDLHGSFMVFW